MMRLVCWLVGHRWTFANGTRYLDRLQLGLPVVWCDRCDPQGRVHRVVVPTEGGAQ